MGCKIAGGWPRLLPAAPHAKPGELLHLDLLRFLASLGIVLTHSLEFLVRRNERVLSRAHAGLLALCVDIFFVISGYVIAHIYAGRIGSVRDYARFLQRRVARLVPLHLVVLVAWFALYSALAAAHLPLNHEMSFSPACMASTVLLLAGVVDCGGRPIGAANWSISAEMVMYLLFPVFLWLVSGGRWRGWALTALLIAAVWVINDGATWQEHADVRRAFPAFALGITYYLNRDKLALLPSPRWGLAVLCLVYAAGVVVAAPDLVVVAIAYAIPAFAIAADCVGVTGAILRRWAPLGQLTYSVYMIHGLIITVLLNGVADKLLKLPLWGMVAATGITYIIILLTARLSLRWLEEPARAVINRVGWPHRQRVKHT